MNPYDEITNAAGVYFVLNRENSRVYIGQSEVICNRIRTHVQQLRLGNHPNKAWQQDWNDYGESAFEFGVLTTIPGRFPRHGCMSLIDLETIFIRVYQAKDPTFGYNMPDMPRRKPRIAPIDPLDVAANEAARRFRPT